MIQPLFEHQHELTTTTGQRVLELEGDGIPILMLHGYADSADTWRLSLDRLARLGRRVVAVDLPGFEKADRLDVTPILPQLDAFAAAAVDYLAGRPRRHVIVVATPWAGRRRAAGGRRPAARRGAAERRPDRLAGVVAVAPAGLEMSRLLHLVQRDPLLRTVLALPSPVPSLVLRSAVAQRLLYRGLAFATPDRVDSAVISAFTAHHGDRARVAGYLATARRLIPELKAPTSSTG